MGRPKSQLHLGLRLVWLSSAYNRERHTVLWYETATTRATARAKYEKETIGGKPKFIRIEEVMRDR